MLVRIRAIVLAAGSVAALYGCEGPTTPTADFDNVEVSYVLHAVNGSPVLLHSALAVRFAQTSRVDAGFAFDVAFDIDSAGNVVAYTQEELATELVASHRVGLQTTSATYAQVDRAPVSGYVYDSLARVPVGHTLLIDAFDSGCQSSFIGPSVRAKVTIDSVNPVTRAIGVKILANPNCGFKSLVTGEPKD